MSYEPKRYLYDFPYALKKLPSVKFHDPSLIIGSSNKKPITPSKGIMGENSGGLVIPGSLRHFGRL
jgi:hypothetical protein